MFNSITKKLKGDQPSVKKNEEIEGFICPICMASFTSPEMVQKHFDDKHPEDNNEKNIQSEALFSPTTQRKESIRDIQENLNDLRQSLDEEVWYNVELKKECTRLNELISEHEKNILSRDKVIEDYTKQITEAEAARDTLNEELKKMQISRTSLMAENKTIRSDFRIYEDKMIELERTRDELTLINERQKQECVTLTEEITKIRSTTNVDDERLLQLTEQLMATNNLLEVKEKEFTEVSTEFEELKTQHSNIQHQMEEKCKALLEEKEQLQTQMSLLVNSSDNVSMEYQNKLHLSSVECDELKKKNDSLKETIKDFEDSVMKMKRITEVDKSQIVDFQARLKDSTDEAEVLKVQNRDLVQKMKNHEIEMLQIRNACSNKDDEIRTLQKSAKSTSEELTSVKLQLEVERSAKDELQSKVEMTDAGNIVMEQMQMEKRNLQEQVTTLKSQLDEEMQRGNSELSMSRLEIQSQKEEILKLTSILSEKEDTVKESEKRSADVQVVCERYQQKINDEISSRSNLEDNIMTLTRELQKKEESLNTAIESLSSLKKEHDNTMKQFQQERDATKENLETLNKQIEVINLKTLQVEKLEKEIDEANAKVIQLEENIKKLTNERYSLLEANETLKNNEEQLKTKLQCEEQQCATLADALDNKCHEMECQINIIKTKDTSITDLQEQIAGNMTQISDLNGELTVAKECECQLRQQVDLKEEEIILCRQSIGKLETDVSGILKEKSIIELELSLTKENIVEKDVTISKLLKEKMQLEDICIDKDEAAGNLRSSFDSMKKEKENTERQLSMARIQIEETQRLYSESMHVQNVTETELKEVKEEHDIVNKELSTLTEEHKKLQSEYSSESEKLRKEAIQLKNHIMALEKTLNESSENYKQEILDSTERELTLKSHCEELESNLLKLTKSLQRTEEDLESEKNLRQTERNNMMEKISQLTGQVTDWDKLRTDLEQKLDTIETDNIEMKIRFDAEKEKLLENIIQLENNLKKQNDSLTKKCREFDQLQSAILDLGRENQSLQITKEKITSRLWIVDDEAVECHNCHKLFSLTNRKHHCRNCGQVFCQDCSMKTATLAVSRKPVRVCDVCHLEVSSHRRNSNSTQSSIMSLSLQN